MGRKLLWLFTEVMMRTGHQGQWIPERFTRQKKGKGEVRLVAQVIKWYRSPQNEIREEKQVGGEDKVTFGRVTVTWTEQAEVKEPNKHESGFYGVGP